MTRRRSSIWRVFSILKNVEKISKGKIINNIDDLVAYQWYERAPKYVVDRCGRIYNEIENHWYTYQDFIIYVLYLYLFEEKLDYKKLKYDGIKIILEKLTKKEIKKDQEKLKQINQEVKLKNITEYFKIKSDGEPIIFKLIEQEIISPMFFIKYKKYIDGDDSKKSKKLLRFEKILTKITQELIKRSYKNGKKS
jgi:hypothetical protein